MADESLDRIEKLVGRGASARIIFRSQKHISIAEVTVKARQHTVVGVAEAPDLTIALRTALEKTEKQAIRWRKSKVEKKRQAKPISAVLPEVPTETIAPEEVAAADRSERKRGIAREEKTFWSPHCSGAGGDGAATDDD